jgi:hypothetical protein
MTLVNKITVERLKEVYSYDEKTGMFSHRSPSRKSRGFKSDSPNYRVIKVDGVSLYAHRAAWAYMTGSWPKEYIDHIDGDHLNNKFENLRDVSQSANMLNLKGASKKNKASGLLGVFRNRDKWVSRLVVDGVKHHCGSFDSPLDAHNSYLEAKVRLVGAAA